MGQRRGVCRLCLRQELLFDSHLVPPGAFKILREDSSDNPNPFIIGEDTAYTTSKQVTDYLLCGYCERRFSENGEKWVLANCYRPDGTFPIRASLTQRVPVFSKGGLLVYRAARIPEIDCQKLVYFAMSVFWRAGAHSWPWQGDCLHIDLGAYLEPIRVFLMGLAAFPPRTALVVRVSGLDKFQEKTLLPQSRNEDGYHSHFFMIPGLTFIVAVGGRIPSDALASSTAPAPECFVAINPRSEIEELMSMSKAVRSVRSPKGYKGL